MTAALREASDELLAECLRRALGETGERRDVRGLSRRSFAYETSFAIEELEVELAGGTTLALVAKDVGLSGLSAEAAAVKPRFTLDPDREIEVYRSLQSVPGLGAPRFGGAAVDPDVGRHWLFLERVAGEVLTDVGDPAAWRDTATWAGRLDAEVGDRRPTRHLLDRDERWHAHWIEAAAEACAVAGRDPLAGRLRAAGRALVVRLEALPRAFIHGELYSSNVIVGEGPAGRRIAPVDWELAGTGPFALDLAALVGGWGRDDRLAMCEAFLQSQPAPTGEATTLAELDAATTACELALALQWIGWAPDWVAPAAHRRDWPAEAERLLGELGL